MFWFRHINDFLFFFKKNNCPSCQAFSFQTRLHIRSGERSRFVGGSSCLLWKFILQWWWMHSWTVSLHLWLWGPPSHPFLYHNGCWYNRAAFCRHYTGYTGRLRSWVCESPLTSHSTLIPQWCRGIRLVSSFICLEGCLWLLSSLSRAPRWDHSASLCKVSLALINIHTCSGHLNFPLEAEVAAVWSGRSCPAVWWRRVTWE